MQSTVTPRGPENPRVVRERRTVRHMVEIYCRGHHQGSATLCEQCDGLYSYAMARLDHCVYRDDKPTCRKCPVHCYKKDMRAEMRQVMKYSGPRMLRSHPVLAILHLLEERRPMPARPARSTPP